MHKRAGSWSVWLGIFILADILAVGVFWMSKQNQAYALETELAMVSFIFKLHGSLGSDSS